MLTVETLLLVALGALLAGLFVLLVAPSYWARAVRITTERIRASIPVDEREVEAEHGRLRAQHALAIHDLRSQLERTQQRSAHGRIEVNRRDAQISTLKRRIEELQTALEVNENARRVLEQTITARVPDVERHLREAQRSLEERDREVARLKAESAKAYRALQEAIDIGDQQRGELANLKERIESRSVRGAASAPRASTDSELSLRSELEQARARTRAQQLTIADLTKRLAAHGESIALVTDEGSATQAETAASAGKADESNDAALLDLHRQIAERDREIADLKASVAALEEDAREAPASRFGTLMGARSSRDARLGDLEGKLKREKEHVSQLQGELAAANEKLARQAAHFMEELRRLGGRRGPTNSSAKRAADFEPRTGRGEPARPSLRERITEEVPPAAPEQPSAAVVQLAAVAPARARDRSAQTDNKPSEALSSDASASEGTLAPEPAKPRLVSEGPSKTPDDDAKPVRSGGLMARISDMEGEK